MLQQVALVSQSTSIPLSEVVKVSAAIQKQATRDFAPLWEVSATVDAFARLADVPLGYWPVVIREDIIDKWEAAGIHLDESGQPFALVQAAADWSLTASHETLEMLADPFGDRLVAGDAPKEAKAQKRVEFLVEVCDPSEAAAFAYKVNDVLVSDFYTPKFWDPVASAGVRYCFGGAIKGPRTILKGGYLSWHNTKDNHWYQLRWFNTPKPVVADLGVFAASAMSTREWIDRQTVTPRRRAASSAAIKARALFAAMVPGAGTPESAGARAASLERQIARLLGKA
jgi:hypothetical protein